ncbi:MAG: hypothetical protein GEU90_18515 [Gemmatimonas sp.]|nr:hypothetical protein [Gemmatimonas sp.]
MTVTTGLPGLNETQRATLEKLVARARSVLEDDFAAQAEGRFGIHGDGRIEDEAALPDDNVAKAIRGDLVEIIEHLQTLDETPAGAVARVLREAAFTHLNRLFAIRIAEALDLLPESLGNGRRSRGFMEFGEVMPILSDDYWGYLQLCGDELAPDVPSLFDPRNPLLRLAPRKAALDELVGLLADPAIADVWPAPDTVGWTYQFFNTGDERRQMRESGAPRDSRELAVRNQFFTPRYVVDFLVHNTLGRRLVEDDPTSALRDELPLLVDPPTVNGSPLELDEVAVLDPACGSGHFLLGCYDVLERAWELRGVPPAESAPAIVSSLWGVDIDSRCAQVASAAIVLRARRHCRDLPLPKPNVVTARNFPAGADALPADLNLSDQQRKLVDRINEVLASAPSLGPLLKAEEALEQEIRQAPFDGTETLPLTEDAFGDVEAELLEHLQAIADRASSSVVERLLAAETDDALRFVELLRRRYDVVLMNPPFGEPIPETKDYLRTTYPALPSNRDLFAAFVDRGVELCRPEGYLGAITSRAGFFLTTFERWRHELLDDRGQLVCVADLGIGVMQQAMVEAAAYVISPPGSESEDEPAVFFRLLDEADKATALGEAVRYSRSRFDKPVRELLATPGSALSYWMPDAVHDLLKSLPLEGNLGTVRRGSWPGEDFRFVRLWWEVAASRRADRHWVAYAKGGEYSPGLSDPHLVIAWDDERGTFRGFYGRKGRSSHKPESADHFFKPGLTWPRRTQGGFNPRILPADCAFADKGPAIVEIGDADAVMALLGWLLSRPFLACLESAISFGSYEVGIVQRMPAYPDSSSVIDPLRTAGEEIIGIQSVKAAADEVDLRFERPSALPVAGAVSIEQAAHRALRDRANRNVRVDESVATAEVALHRELGLSGAELAFLDGEIGALPALYEKSDAPPPDNFADELHAALVAGQTRPSGVGMSAEAWFDVLCLRYRTHPATVFSWLDQCVDEVELTLAQEAAAVCSYLVGLAFGRWDVQLAASPGAGSGREPMAGLPACSPAMLADADALPAMRAPADYPLELPPERTLVDEPGTQWDIEARVMAAALAVLQDPAAVVSEMLELLGRKTIRDYLRKQFFKDHLSRYSKSRRKAPIYWPLTVPSGNWGVWVYAPMLTRETLFAVAREAARRERLAAEAITRLEREQGEGGAGRRARHIAAELDAEHKLHEALRHFRAEAERIAGLGWEPDLEDGMVLCAAPLADLFPAWPDAMKARDELRKGRYEWATVAKWADQL